MLSTLALISILIFLLLILIIIQRWQICRLEKRVDALEFAGLDLNAEGRP